MPIVYLNNIEGGRIAAVTANVLMLVILIIMQVIEKRVKKIQKKIGNELNILTTFQTILQSSVIL